MVKQRSYQLHVVDVIKETPEAHSVVFEPADHEVHEFEYQPGQFLTFNIPTDWVSGAARCYSLSSSPGVDERLKVTVKRTEDGYSSNWICDNLVSGSSIEVLAPSGTFTPKSLDEDFLLMAGGSGITPVMSIIKAVLYRGNGNIVLVYANRNENAVIFSEELTALENEFKGRLTVIHVLESLQGLPGQDQLRELIRPYSHSWLYTCGPEQFMEVVYAAAAEAGLPRERQHREEFFSLSNNPFAETEIELDTDAPTSTVEVQLDDQTTNLDWPSNNKMLDVFLDSGLDAPFSCREGNCSACACILLEGEVKMENNNILEAEDIADGIILACQSLPVSDHVRVSYDE